MASARKPATGRKGPPPPAEMLELPNRLRRAIKERGAPKQMELAHRAGVSQSVISRLTSDDPPLEGVTAATIARLAQALDVSSGWLLLGEQDEIPRIGRPVLGKHPSGANVLTEEASPRISPSASPSRGAAATPAERDGFPARRR